MKKSHDKLICVGKIVGVHGIKGNIKIQSFTVRPIDFSKYGTIFNNNGEEVIFISVNLLPNGIILANVKACNDRTQAEKLIGTELFVLRDSLPPLDEGEYYFNDLINLEVIDESKTLLGHVKAVCDYGAGTFLDIKDLQGKDRTIPFNADSILEITGDHILIDANFLL